MSSAPSSIPGRVKPKNRVFVIGVGLTKFEKPGQRNWDYPEMSREAIEGALADCRISFGAIEAAACGFVYGDSTCAQRALYEVGITGIPVYNTNNNCASGSTALYMARQWIESGQNDCVLAFGFEKMERGALKAKWTDRTNPLDKHLSVMNEKYPLLPNSPFACQLFANAGREHMEKYHTRPEHFAKIAEKNHRHSVNNPYSQYQNTYTVEEIMNARMIYSPMTIPQCCPTSEGAGAAILCSEAFIHQWGLYESAIEIRGMSMKTDFPSSFSEKSMIKVVGFDMTKAAAVEALQQANLPISAVQVVELHDCFSANELITYEALGLCPVGKAGEFIDSGNNTYGGKFVVNPSGGLLSKGHPLGATGFAQCCELVWQLRGKAEKRQVPNVSACLQHNLGLGGAAVVAIYSRPFPPIERKGNSSLSFIESSSNDPVNTQSLKPVKKLSDYSFSPLPENKKKDEKNNGATATAANGEEKKKRAKL